MHSMLPVAKLIYIVRDPINRIVSHYMHGCASGREQRKLVDALSQEVSQRPASFLHLDMNRLRENCGHDFQSWSV
jgi:hypothetical protein